MNTSALLNFYFSGMMEAVRLGLKCSTLALPLTNSGWDSTPVTLASNKSEGTYIFTPNLHCQTMLLLSSKGPKPLYPFFES